MTINSTPVRARQVGVVISVAEWVYDDPQMWEYMLPQIKASAREKFSELGTIIEGTLRFSVEEPDPIDPANYDSESKPRPYCRAYFTAYVIPTRNVE